nr:hypothetical protein CFP56_61289 [Quercus suber]
MQKRPGPNLELPVSRKGLACVLFHGTQAVCSFKEGSGLCPFPLDLFHWTQAVYFKPCAVSRKGLACVLFHWTQAESFKEHPLCGAATVYMQIRPGPNLELAVSVDFFLVQNLEIDLNGCSRIKLHAIKIVDAESQSDIFAFDHTCGALLGSYQYVAIIWHKLGNFINIKPSD